MLPCAARAAPPHSLPHLCAAGLVEQHAGHQQLPGIVKQLLLCITPKHKLCVAHSQRAGRRPHSRPAHRQPFSSVLVLPIPLRPADLLAAYTSSCCPLTQQAIGGDGWLPQAQAWVWLIHCCCRRRRCCCYRRTLGGSGARRMARPGPHRRGFRRGLLTPLAGGLQQWVGGRRCRALLPCCMPQLQRAGRRKRHGTWARPLWWGMALGCGCVASDILPIVPVRLLCFPAVARALMACPICRFCSCLSIYL